MILDYELGEKSIGWCLHHAVGARGPEAENQATLAYCLFKRKCSIWIDGFGITAQQALSLDMDWFFNKFLTRSSEAMMMFLNSRFDAGLFAANWITNQPEPEPR